MANVFVSRDGSNNVSGVFKRPQPGFATEVLPDTNQEVIDFLSLQASIGDTQPQFVGTFSDSNRPAAGNCNIGDMIYNTDDNAPNWCDGTSWRDAMGTIT